MRRPVTPSVLALAGANMPGWVRDLVRLGVINGIAVFLVWWLTTSVTVRLSALEEAYRRHETARAREEQLTNAFLYAICLNGASDDTARARCAVALDGTLMARP